MSNAATDLRLPGDGAGVLLCHGFTSNPSSLALWAEGLAAAGADVRVPRLPGHGTHWRDLNRTGWPDWYACVERSLLEAADSRGGPIVVGGLSMGGALALRLAQLHPNLVAGLILVNPAVLLTDRRLAALPVLRRLTPSIAPIASDIAKPGVVEVAYDRTPLHALASSLKLYRAVRADLPGVSTPLLMLRSRVDHVVPVASPAHVLSTIGSTDVTDITLERSYHVATMDHDADVIVSESVRFIDRVGDRQAEVSR